MAMLTPNVTSVARRATPLMSCSCALGMASTIAMPTAGTKITSVSAHESNQSNVLSP
jgi:hypothetical protein